MHPVSLASVFFAGQLHSVQQPQNCFLCKPRTATGTHLGVNRPVQCSPELRQQCKLARRRFGICWCQGYADACHTCLHT